MSTQLATALLSQVALRFVLLGLATGSLTGLVGLGVVLVYRASGILNFAAAALGAVGAFVCFALRDDHGVPGWLSLAIGLAVGAALGAALWAVMALIRSASLLTKLIATLAILIALQSVMTLVWGTRVEQPDPFLSNRQRTLFGQVRIGEDRLVLIGVALALAFALRLLYTKTRFGLATSAVSENRRVAASAGWSTSRIELINFTLAGVLSAFAAIMLAPIITLTASVLSLSILGALAAALVGRFSSFAATVGAALLIGVVQSEVSLFQPDLADFFGLGAASLTGLVDAVPLVIILAVTVSSGRGRLERGETIARLPLPGSGRVNIRALMIGVALAAMALGGVSTWSDALTVTFGLAIVVCSVVVVSGYAGQLSLCQYSLGGFGAWAASKAVIGLGIGFPFALAVGVAAALVAGLLVALPALRTRGVNLAVATLALALLFNALIFTNSGATGGFVGTVVPRPFVFGIDVSPVDQPQRYGAIVLLALVATGLIVANVRRGRVGRRMLAVRGNERAAAALGISVAGVKLYAFGLGAGIAGLGGTLLAFHQENIQFPAFDVFSSIQLVQFAVLGGIGWVSGVVAGSMPAPGGLLFRILNDAFPHVSTIPYWLAIAGALGAVQTIRKAPDGGASIASRVGARRRHGAADSVSATMTAEQPERRVPSILHVDDVTVHFGGVIAIDHVSLTVRPGEIVGLIGPNGAGKTTLLDVITGFTSPDSGAVTIDDVDVTGWTPERRARRGMARSWQGVELFEELTLRDNLLIGCDEHDRRRFLTDLLRPGSQRLSASTQQVIRDFQLTGLLDRKPSSLPQGNARLAGIARAIVGGPSVLLLDEPAAGLGPDETGELAAVIRTIVAERGIGVLVVEHDVPLLLSLCDRIVALDFGTMIAEGSPDEIRNDPEVIRAYLGDTATATA